MKPIAVILATALGALLVALAASYLCVSEAQKDWFEFLGSVLAIVLSGCLVVITLESETESQRNKQTLDMLAFLNKPDFRPIASRATRKAKNGIPELSKKDADRLRVTLGHFEDLALAIREGLANEKIAHRSLQYWVTEICRKYRWFIDKEKRLIGKNMYADVLSLAEAWNRGVYLKSRKNIADQELY